MKLGSVFADGHSNDSMFREADPVHRFNPTFTMRTLRDAFAQRGMELHTADLNVGRAVDFELHIEGRPLAPSPVPRFLLALENPYINPLNADAAYFGQFRRVFSWDPRFLQLPNVTEIAYGMNIVMPPWPDFAQRDIFSCLINANKRFTVELPNDLYTERVNVIRWHEHHAPRDFELYGMGWDKPRHESGAAGKARRRLQRLATQLFGYRPFPSWKGPVPDKADVLLRAKFSYCYENVGGLAGYVTEKIFDSLMNGCVPVYWGPDEIEERIPVDCFVDRRRFKSTADVHAFLRSITPDEYTRRQQAMRAFLESAAAERYTAARLGLVVAEGVVAGV
jgi:hypothetical protein